jgi:hypothetical protein
VPTPLPTPRPPRRPSSSSHKPVSTPQPPKNPLQHQQQQTSRVAVNIEKMKLLKQRLSECVRREGAAHLDRCEQLTRRYEAAVRVCQWNSGPSQRPRNTGDIMSKEAAMQQAAE